MRNDLCLSRVRPRFSRRPGTRLAVTALIGVGLLAACGSDDDSTADTAAPAATGEVTTPAATTPAGSDTTLASETTAASDDTTPVAAPTETLRIGLIYSQTGAVAPSAGFPFFRGVTMAADDINASGGVQIGGKGYKVEFIECDDQSGAEGAATCGQQISTQDKPALIMTNTSYGALALMGFNVENNFMIYAPSQALAVTAQGNPLVVRGVQNSSKTMPTFVDQVVALLDKAELTGRKAYSMQVNTDLGIAWHDSFEAEWTKHGGEITGRGTIDNAATDFSAQVTEALSTSPDWLALTTVSAPSTLVMEEARRQGFKGGFITTAGTTPEDIAKLDPATSALYIGESTVWNVDNQINRDLKARYAEKYNDEITPNLSFGSAFDALNLVTKAFSIAGVADDPAALRAAMAQAIDETDTVLQIRGIDETGDPDLNVIPSVVFEGKSYGLDEASVDTFLADNPGWATQGQ
jgi:branched-chain amino acid transport system substrate-binding protein